MAGAVGDQESLCQIAHTDRSIVESDLVEDVVVGERSAELGSQVGVHRDCRHPVEPDESFPRCRGVALGHRATLTYFQTEIVRAPRRFRAGAMELVAGDDGVEMLIRTTGGMP